MKEVEQMIAQTAAARDVLAERARQISAEGWTLEHDDRHDDGSLALAGACYAREAWSSLPTGIGDTPVPGWAPEDWPWHPSWWRPSDMRRNLVKAAALILAEIERIDRRPCDEGGAP